MKKKQNKTAFAEQARREQEIAQYGKILSLRPSVVHKSKKTYNRRNNKKEISRQIDISFFLYYI